MTKEKGTAGDIGRINQIPFGKGGVLPRTWVEMDAQLNDLELQPLICLKEEMKGAD